MTADAAGSVWTVVEAPEQGPGGGATLTRRARQVLSLAQRLGRPIDVWTWGGEASAVLGEFGGFGVRRVHDVGALPESFPGPALARALAAAWPDERPDWVLVTAGYDGRETAGRLSALLDLPVLGNASGLADDGGSLVTEHEALGGSVHVTARFAAGTPGIALVRPAGDVEPAEVAATEPELVAVTPAPGDAAREARVVERHRVDAGEANLEEARLIVSGGRGLGSPQNYEMVERLAVLLGGAPGASRAIVDAGWTPYARQVGQTGKSVKPDVYIACGISGAIQHLAGIRKAKRIVSVNTDPEAPIVGFADLAVVGDVKTVLPQLIEEMERRQA